MKVFRVENEYQEGCYACHLPELKKMYDKHNKDVINRPITNIDVGRNVNKNEIHAFINKEQALKWFTKKDLQLLKKSGFDLKEIDVKEITAIGKKQVLVIRENLR